MGCSQRLSPAALDYIERAGLALDLGKAELHQIPLELAGFYFLAFSAGAESCAPLVAQLRRKVAYLEHTADRLYVAAFNPRDRAELINKRLDEHFAREWQRIAGAR